MSLEFWQSPEFPGLETLNQLLLWTRRRGEAPLMCYKREGIWVTVTARQFYDRVRSVASGFQALGLQPGERVAILSENRPAWLMCDFACLALGLVDVPIYPTLPADQTAYILRHSGARLALVSTAQQAEKVHAQWSTLPELRALCCFDDRPEPAPPIGPQSRLPSWSSLQHHAPFAKAEFEARLNATRPDTIATLLYTSGTTGVPKGVPLTHRNLCACLNYAAVGFDFGPGDVRLSFLPISHITERHLNYGDQVFGIQTCFAESLEKVAENLLEIRPTVIASVPRIYEKVAAAVRAQAAAASPARRRLFAWALKTGREMAPYKLKEKTGMPGLGLQLRYRLADRLVYRRLRQRLGGRLRIAIAGGAPLGRELAEFLLHLGLMVDEGYGLTETSPVIAVNKPGARRPGSVGKPLPNLQVRFRPDGELLVKGPTVFSGYYQNPEETAAVFEEGWFATGDIGHLDADGFLFITDRKKDLLKTSGGKFIAPQPIENRLKASSYIAEAVVVGDGYKYACALLTPNFAALEDWARKQGWTWQSRAELSNRPETQALYQQEIDAVNQTLARFETIKRFTLLSEEFSLEEGEITPTIKVRRRRIAEKYREQIAAMYPKE